MACICAVGQRVRVQPPMRKPLPMRRDRGWQSFDRWIRRHRLIQTLVRRVTYMFTWQVVRKSGGNAAGGAQVVQTAGGGAQFGAGSDYTELNDDAPIIEQQGLASGIGVGARGLVASAVGGVAGSACMIGPRKLSQRPTFLADWEVCLYQESGSRVLLTEGGEARLEAGLADYKDDGADLDEGSKVRANAGGVQGELELYGEAEVRQRAQPSGGSGASATTILEATGAATLSINNGAGITATITLVAGEITVENSAGAQIVLRADGVIEVGVGAVLGAARSTDPVNPAAAMAAWALALETFANSVVLGTFTPANSFATTVLAGSGNFGTIGTTSAAVLMK